MKKLFFAVSALFCFADAAFAQKDSLQFDEANQYVYYRVTEKPGTSNDSLYSRGLQFVKYLKTKSVDQNTPNAVSSKGKFIIYTTSLVSKKEAGEIAYQLQIDTKEGKYRYKFSDFELTPYKIDRYGNMVAVPGIHVPAEKLSAKYSKKDTETYLDQIGAFCRTTAKQITAAMDRKPALRKEQSVRKVSTDKW